MDTLQKSYEIFASLIEKRGITPYRVYKDTGVPQSSLSEWKRGNSMPKIDKIKKLAEYFNVSVDYLLGNEQQETPALTKKDERDIAKELARIRDSLENADGLMFDGDPMTDEARESILAAMKLGLEAAKLKNKEKYTPKKYKKD